MLTVPTRFWSGVMGWNFGSGVFEQFDYRMAQIAPDAAVADHASRGTGTERLHGDVLTWNRRWNA